MPASPLPTPSPCDPSSIPALEDHVRSQVSAAASALSADCEYSFDSNRALVKLYGFFPERSGSGDGGGEAGGGRTEVSSLVLFLSLLRFPSTDFAALACLVPEAVQSAEPAATLVRCADLLDGCRFADFWPEVRKLGMPEYGLGEGEAPSDDRRLLSDAINGTSAPGMIRANVIRMLARTFRTAPLPMVLAALDVKDAESLAAFGSKVMMSSADGGENETPVLEKVEGDVVTFTASADNTKRVGSAFKDNVGYDEVARMMARNAVMEQ